MTDRMPFLLEIGVEEIPHWMIEPALGEMERMFKAFTEEARLESGGLRLDATPRRLVLRVAQLEAGQQNREELVLGPPKSAGAGAAAGFAKKNQVAVESLETEVTPKGEYFALRRKVSGRSARELLAEALPAMIAKIPWPKAMYWTGKDGVRFIRPIRWIACLMGDQVVEFEIAGVRSGALSRGHRRLGADEIAFDHSNYEERLKKNGVILNSTERRKKIETGIRKLLKGTGFELVRDEALLSDLVYLTEFPTPILGEFDAKFLDLPREVLTTVMRHHQRYFTLKSADGRMAPAFVAVMNIKSDRQGFVRKGNERVLEARFNDARFFWDVDQQKHLKDRVEDLSAVTFQARLGSYRDKTAGIESGAARIAKALNTDPQVVRRAATLSKADLVTEMVKELTELQGVMGGLYARSQGESEDVAQAVYEHYMPQSMEEKIPASIHGQVLSVADKLDTLEGCFALGMTPTGSKDPLGLRRAAQGVVKVLVEGRLALNLKEAIAAGAEETHRLFVSKGMAGYGGARGEDGVLEWNRQLWDFLQDRMRYYFREVRGFAYDEVNAVMAAAPETLPDMEDRLFALKMVRQTENFEPLAASFKRIRNILRQAAWTGGEVQESLFADPAERELHTAVSEAKREVERLMAARDYIRSLQIIATLRPAVDKFFDDVLVNAPDAAVRSNRLSLLGNILNAFSSIADFSEVVTESTNE